MQFHGKGSLTAALAYRCLEDEVMGPVLRPFSLRGLDFLPSTFVLAPLKDILAANVEYSPFNAQREPTRLIFLSIIRLFHGGHITCL